MRLLMLSLSCAAISIMTPANAEIPASGSDLVVAQLFQASHRTVERRMSGRSGQRGIRTTHWTEPKKTKQDIEDEKKLAHDLNICSGC